MPLVTLSEVKGVLKYTDVENDARLSLLLEGASLSILRYLKTDGEEYQDSNGELVPGNVPDDIKWATIHLVGAMDRNPDINDSNIFESDYLPKAVEALLHSRRDPTLA